MARTIINPTGKMALTPSFPVDVFIKSAPKIKGKCNTHNCSAVDSSLSIFYQSNEQFKPVNLKKFI